MKTLTTTALHSVNGAGNETIRWKPKSETDLIAMQAGMKKLAPVVKTVCESARVLGKIYLKELSKPMPYELTLNPYTFTPIFTTRLGQLSVTQNQSK